jgi:hypothetical protein
MGVAWTSGWATAAVCTEAAPAVKAMAVLIESGSSVGASVGENTGAQENPRIAAIKIIPIRFVLLMATFHYRSLHRDR